MLHALLDTIEFCSIYITSLTPVSAIILQEALLFGISGYLTYYRFGTTQDTLAASSVGLLIALPARALKLLEGAFYVFMPIPMFAVNSWAR
jgi:hypothetical protein